MSNIEIIKNGAENLKKRRIMTNTAVLREDLPNMTFSSYVHCIRKIKLIKFSNIYIYFIYKISDVLDSKCL